MPTLIKYEATQWQIHLKVSQQRRAMTTKATTIKKIPKEVKKCKVKYKSERSLAREQQ